MIPLVVAKKNGVLDEYIRLKAYEAWKETKQPLYNGIPLSLMK